MIDWENEVAAVRFGLQILIRAETHREAQTYLRAMAQHPHMEPDLSRNMIRCQSGGFAHFVWNDEQVRGMEYHDNLGPFTILTPAMKSRVRLH